MAGERIMVAQNFEVVKGPRDRAEVKLDGRKFLTTIRGVAFLTSFIQENGLAEVTLSELTFFQRLLRKSPRAVLIERSKSK